ncbi:MAG: hypothetical protein MJ189_05490 [Coriobacteriales bacterium]|nr:hypothetical protein [Coriobacteriales bacterium]
MNVKSLKIDMSLIKIPKSNNKGQMAVELAITIPIILIVMVIALDIIMFMLECEKFDNYVEQLSISCASSIKGNAYKQSECDFLIEEKLQLEFNKFNESINLESLEAGLLNDYVEYKVTLHMAPWPLNPQGIKIFGVEIPTFLSHSKSLVVRPFVPGRF